ncbi:MAG TPA: hypothetical protein VN754_05740 [Candidatus Binataceae bacterium]|nr:hypothetical protein [Candidatus Binataceae bacterium]
MAIYSAAVGIAAIALAIVAAPSWAGNPDDNAVPIVRPMVGCTIPEIVEQLGRPFMTTPLRETGGKLMFFENAHGDQFIIETDGTGIVIDAVVKHPEGR